METNSALLLTLNTAIKTSAQNIQNIIKYILSIVVFNCGRAKLFILHIYSMLVKENLEFLEFIIY